MTDAPFPPNRSRTSSAARKPDKPQRTWVPETRFGQWFIGTQVWERYVVEIAVQQLARLLGGRGRPPRRVLDAGCGPGVSLPLLERHIRPGMIVALDVDPQEIERARTQARRCTCPVEFCQNDAARLDFPEGAFDLILCHQMLHHVVEQEAVLRELHRVLAPGGALLIAESCREFILSTPVRALFRHPNEVQKTADEYQQLLRDAGFLFGPADVETSRPFWSLGDWGLGERLGWRAGRASEPTQLAAVAFKAGPA